MDKGKVIFLKRRVFIVVIFQVKKLKLKEVVNC